MPYYEGGLEDFKAMVNGEPRKKADYAFLYERTDLEQQHWAVLETLAMMMDDASSSTGADPTGKYAKIYEWLDGYLIEGEK